MLRDLSRLALRLLITQLVGTCGPPPACDSLYYTIDIHERTVCKEIAVQAEPSIPRRPRALAGTVVWRTSVAREICVNKGQGRRALRAGCRLDSGRRGRGRQWKNYVYSWRQRPTNQVLVHVNKSTRRFLCETTAQFFDLTMFPRRE
ncbi:hypothetical protein BU23DRAFT_268596 [Bimuria novae-zelandiae CBS 107.79]|uniref:Secreted protein n=1 Tax=Bimuria novae-zelandiae CBS 107.79 TaxID=1447943 RepID=A0A6A5UU21_9PLEO|nr:hypothetical protein BU23DRAFT_268596 [Bimuria novae-zelandiae CBS 107.79]